MKAKTPRTNALQRRITAAIRHCQKIQGQRPLPKSDKTIRVSIKRGQTELDRSTIKAIAAKLPDLYCVVSVSPERGRVSVVIDATDKESAVRLAKKSNEIDDAVNALLPAEERSTYRLHVIRRPRVVRQGSRAKPRLRVTSAA